MLISLYNCKKKQPDYSIGLSISLLLDFDFSSSCFTLIIQSNNVVKNTFCSLSDNAKMSGLPIVITSRFTSFFLCHIKTPRLTTSNCLKLYRRCSYSYKYRVRRCFYRNGQNRLLVRIFQDML